MKQKTPEAFAPSAQNKPNYSSADNTTIPSGAPVDRLLARLDKVRPNGKDRWLACCPAHEDRTPSLSVRECSDGTVLVKCWAGCTARDITAAIGMELRDLFPPKPFRNSHRAPAGGLPYAERRKLSNALHTENLIIEIFDQDRANGLPLTDEDRERVGLAMAYAKKFRRALGVKS